MLWLQVVLAEGDLNSEHLGLSAATTQQLLEQVDIVIHSAASIGRWGDATEQCVYGCCF
jgi:thioester reductase-like protein